MVREGPVPALGEALPIERPNWKPKSNRPPGTPVTWEATQARIITERKYSDSGMARYLREYKKLIAKGTDLSDMPLDVREAHRQYMREYMREYRARKKAGESTQRGRKLTLEMAKSAKTLVNEGQSLREVARSLDVDHAYLQRRISQLNKADS